MLQVDLISENVHNEFSYICHSFSNKFWKSAIFTSVKLTESSSYKTETFIVDTSWGEHFSCGPFHGHSECQYKAPKSQFFAQMVLALERFYGMLPHFQRSFH